ncbi:hypothetical protein [Lewinella sp. LCG006]|uniref:hypothetical protein n=1 Tax=Lewinella sp. LCG006 TaxID=3231911 RepID=UPI0034614A0E
MFNRFFLLFFVVTFVTSCGPEPKFSKENLAEQEQAWAQMMEGHDVVMPLMNDLYQASSKLKALAEDAMVEASDFHPRAQEALANIEKAEDGMMAWMGSIKDSPIDSVRARYEDHAAVMAFIDKEKTDIEQVAENMQASLATAKALIQERTGN